MKFLAALVHAAAAAIPIHWDFTNPAQGDEGVYIADGKWAVAFRTPASGTTDNTTGLTRNSNPSFFHFWFTISTDASVPATPSMSLQLELCPSAHDLPDCTNSIVSLRIPISNDDVNTFNGGNLLRTSGGNLLRSSGGVYSWFPEPEIVGAPNTTYWFVLGASSESWVKGPIWLFGQRHFSTATNVNVATFNGEDNSWSLIPFNENNRLLSLIVVATYTH
ncbi:hypothetical protein DYB26_012138 [Aphanomyces astaci]|uniref:Uncharacterized protein n=1 Tax=Aphanomyces astaci TaxID=112090 RepID=A0A397EMZ6_APHAT|nr:hypothetical protein DYB26_012138 [Aphanomyces astaci]RHY91414.1 hypothetical protein DYB31_007945 [Aphanomyces astaci]